jgi:Heparinase II/III-like protein/Domain of unknown function (DUF4962)
MSLQAKRRCRIIAAVSPFRLSASIAICFALIGPAIFSRSATAAAAATTAASSPDVLATLRPGHPRLLVLDEDIARVKQAIKTDKIAGRYFELIQQAGDKVLTEPVAQRVLQGPRLLGVSRQVLARVQTLAGLYRLTGEKKYAQRAVQEMLAVAAFSDWHPQHFLDVAEMTNAIATGYDWLFDVLTPEQRDTIRDAIVEKGLKPGLSVYSHPGGFDENTNNWNQVCNGGMTVGALAVADEEPQIARQVIENARASLPRAMRLFAPDGGCEEGPGYWAYATSYTCYYLAACQTALGTDFGFLKTPGLSDTGLFRIHAIGPLGRTFNYADANDGVAPSPQMFYFARVFNHPEYAAEERMTLGGEKPRAIEPLHLLWYDAAGGDEDLRKLPTTAMFKRVNVAFLRTSWNDHDAAFVGFKGGSNTFSHGHLDLGTFVYDADGVRWAYDLGPDDYNLPGYFGKERWNYYRLKTEGHNTITLNGGENQNVKATAPLVGFSAEHKIAVADLSAAYPSAKRVQRGVKLLGRQLLVQDEIECDEPADVVWNLHTPAKIAIDPSMRRATLTLGRKELTAQILSPATAHFATATADPPPPVKPDPPMRAIGPRDSTKLVVRLPEKVKELRLVVLLSPQGEGVARANLEPLEKWIDAAPIP